MKVAHPLWTVLREQGRSKVWLAKRTGYSYAYVCGVSAGTFNAGERFRRLVAQALDLPENVLFIGPPATVRPYRRKTA